MSIQEILMKMQDKKMEQVIWWFSHHLCCVITQPLRQFEEWQWPCALIMKVQGCPARGTWQEPSSPACPRGRSDLSRGVVIKHHKRRVMMVSFNLLPQKFKYHQKGIQRGWIFTKKKKSKEKDKEPQVTNHNNKEDWAVENRETKKGESSLWWSR